jgi:hypothetical protein
MSDKEYTEDFDDEDLELDATNESVKSSMGDPSEVPDPVNKSSSKNQSSIKMKGSAKAAKLKGVENDKETTSTDLPVKESKFAMMNSVIAEMQNMSKENIADLYIALIGDADLHEEDTTQESTFDVDAEVAEMFAGQEITEDFRAKATTIFEAAVAVKVNEEVESFIVEAAAELEAEKETMLDDLAEKTSEYLDYVTGEYLQENKLAVEQGIKNEIVEDFMTSMKSIFIEHYIEVPEDKVDVVEKLIDKVSHLENELNEITEENVNLNTKIADTAKGLIFSEVAEELTIADAEKLRSFAEGVEASNANDYKAKLKTLKEHYFDGGIKMSETSHQILSEETDGYIHEEGVAEENNTPTMNAYLNALKK